MREQNSCSEYAAIKTGLRVPLVKPIVDENKTKEQPDTKVDLPAETVGEG